MLHSMDDTRPRAWLIPVALVSAWLLGGLLASAYYICAALFLSHKHDRAFEGCLDRVATEAGDRLLFPAAGGVSYLVMSLVFCRFAGECLRDKLRLKSARRLVTGCAVAALGILGYGLIGLSFVALGAIPKSFYHCDLPSYQESVAGVTIMLDVAVSGAIVPFGEECFFRGYAQSVLTRRFGNTTGVIIASGLFAAAHWDPGQMIAYFILGSYLGYVAKVWRSLIPAIAAHSAYNIIIGLILYKCIGEGTVDLFFALLPIGLFLMLYGILRGLKGWWA